MSRELFGIVWGMLLSSSRSEGKLLMSRQEELRGIAIALRRGSPYFSDGWNINMRQAFIRDDGCCVYCGKELLKKFGPSCEACGDHLLPKSLYPDLAENVDNLVPACIECNRMKHNYDASEGKGMEIVITERVRRGLIRKSREVIRRKKMEEGRVFQSGKAAFRRAVAQYRQY